MERIFRGGASLGVAIILCAIVLAGCSAEAESQDPAPTTAGSTAAPGVVETISPGAESDPDMSEALWSESPHASTFVVDENGQNSTCARCHAPVNWVPGMDDMPASCSTCKFEVDPPPPYIEETDWTAVECKVCHELNKKGEVEDGYAWLEIAAIEEYAEVSSPEELCAKCHTNEALAGHLAVSVAGDHLGYACTACHDAHSAAASCGETGCHPAIDAGEPILGHDEDHVQVDCVACHDASSLTVGIDPETALWSTYLDGGLEQAFYSHDTQLGVDCQRCHFEGNPWGIAASVK